MRRLQRRIAVLVVALVVALAWIGTSGGGVAAAAPQVAQGTATFSPPGLKCAGITLRGAFRDTGGQITSMSLSGCTTSGGLSYTITPTFPWTVTYLEAPDAAGWVPITIWVSYRLSGTGCTATFEGTVTGRYNIYTHELQLNGGGSLAATQANCLGLIKAGDHASLVLDVIVLA